MCLWHPTVQNSIALRESEWKNAFFLRARKENATACERVWHRPCYRDRGGSLEERTNQAWKDYIGTFPLWLWSSGSAFRNKNV